MADDLKSSIRVCLASPIFHSTYGGSQGQYLRYLTELRNQGLDVRVFPETPMTDDVTPADVVPRSSTFSVRRMISQDLVNGAAIHRVRLPTEKDSYRRLLFTRSFPRFCRDPAYRPDVLQLMGTLRVGSAPWLPRLRKMRIANTVLRHRRLEGHAQENMERLAASVKITH